MKNISFIFGTRPEAIKLSPLILALRKHPKIEAHVCVTGRHREMHDQVLEAFDIKPDADLNLMQQGQTLAGLTSRAIAAGDATRSYSVNKSREVVRQLVYLKPDIFVAYDRVVSVKPDQKKELLFHTQGIPEQTGEGTWRADHNKGRLFLRSFLPKRAKVDLVGGPGKEFWASGRNWPLETEGAWGKPYKLAGQWRLEFSHADPTAEARFLTML